MDKTQLSSAYRLISELFLHPDHRDAGVIDEEYARLQDAPPVFSAPIETFLAAPASQNDEEYVATLELTPLAPLYLGSYLYDEPDSCRGAGMSGRNGYMLELANIYRHFGVEFVSRELADFVPVIVEFLGISLEREDEDRVGLRRYFVETLLLNGIESLLSALRKCDSPYVSLVEALRVALAQDVAYMAGGPKWQPPADKDTPAMSAAVRGAPATEGAVSENGVEL